IESWNSIRVSQQRPGRGIARIACNHPVQDVHQLSRLASAEKRGRAKIILVRIRILSSIRNERLSLFEAKRHLQRGGNGGCDIFLNGENPLHLAVIALTPEMRTVVGPDELGCDTDLVAILAHRTFDQISGAQGSADGTHVSVFALELEC